MDFMSMMKMDSLFLLMLVEGTCKKEKHKKRRKKSREKRLRHLVFTIRKQR